jgi:predicted transposase/invertase (TIGR01784 family)
MKFLDVRTDFAFKKVFGSIDSKMRLISFLNAIIYENDPTKITDLEIADPYNIPTLKGMKDTYVDVKAVLTDKTTVIIEMQVLNHQGLENRILYNAAKNYSMQLINGEQYSLLKPVIALTIVDFTMFSENNTLVNSFKMLNKKDFTDYNGDIELIFIELTKFTKQETDCQTDFDKWMYFLKNAGDLTVTPKGLPRSIESAYSVSNEAGMTPEELELQYKKREFIAIQRGALTLVKDNALKQGIEQGIEQGVNNRNLEIAKKMKEDGFDSAIISQVTGLSEQEIQSI